MGQGIRFILAGGANTIITIAVYELMLFVVSAAAAYAVAWITGFIATNVIYPLFVFRNRTLTVKKSAMYGIYYVSIFFFSLALLEVIIRHEIILERMAPILLLLIIVPVNFMAARIIFRGSHPSSASEKQT